MKKLILVVLAVLFCTTSFAQVWSQTRSCEILSPKSTTDMPVWAHIGTPFVATDINGNSVNLASILASGQAVVIDYSCTWCGPCWNLHNTGILEAIDTMSNVQVIWVEIERTNTTAQIYGPAGGSSYFDMTYGDWTVDANGHPVTYTIIDDNSTRSCLNTCISLYQGYVPSCYFIAPSGYFCNIYGESYGFSTATTPAQAVANISALVAMAPAPNTVPTVSINGIGSAVVGTTATFSAQYVSADSVLSVNWVFTNGSPATAAGDTATTVWNTTGNEQVILTVTNTTGSSSDTLDVNIFEWNWTDEMTYDITGEMVSSIGTGSGLTWGVQYPAAMMAGRNYISALELYVANAGNYTLDIYQTSGSATPTASDLIFEQTYALDAAYGYVSLPIYDVLSLDPTKNLWVVFSNPDGYPAAASAYSDDPNSCWCYLGSAWDYLFNINPELQYSWMIKVTTSVDVPPMHIAIRGESDLIAGTPYTFTAQGPAGSNYRWYFEGATPATATGYTATATWDAAGEYTISLVGVSPYSMRDSVSFPVRVISCEAQTLPFTCGFEASDNMACWKFIDADGDGFGWDLSSWNGSIYNHSGDNAAGSASLINEVGILNPDNWMITPELVIPAEGATLSFFVGGIDGTYYAENYSVLVSTTGNSISDFTNTLCYNTVAGVDFAQLSYFLGDYAGQTIRLAFRHHNISNMYWMLIDDIEVVPGYHVGISSIGAQVALYPNPTTGIFNVVAEGVQEVAVLDINGRTLATTHSSVVDLTNLANGVYFIRVLTSNGVSTQKIVKR